MTISILSIGDEICIGQIVNTNSAWIAQECARAGFRVTFQSSVGDEIEVILEEFDRLLARTDVLLITGGLGPTHDDRTKDALARYFNDTLTLHQATFDYLREFLAARKREFTERQQTQAYMPSTCEVLPNRIGTAPGMWFETAERKIVVAMPGVPAEMKFLMENSVLPRLKERFSQEPVMVYTTILTNGVIESSLADIIGNPEEFLNGQELAFLPSSSGIRLRITVTAENREKAEEELVRIEQIIRERARKFIYGNNDDSFTRIVGARLQELGKTLAVAESCTGGLLGAALTEMAGSSAYFLGGVQAYSNAIKVSMLGVSAETLARVGAVSKETAEEMARNVRERFGADFGISITGIAGPGGGSPEKPVGTVWIALADAQEVRAVEYIFGNDRTQNRERAVVSALAMLRKKLG